MTRSQTKTLIAKLFNVMEDFKPMKELTLPSGKYLLVDGIPAGKELMLTYVYGDPDLLYKDGEGGVVFVKTLPLAEWQLIGKGGEISEEQWKGIVETEYIEDIGHFPIDYETEESDCSSYTESGLSLLRSHGMNENTIILKEKV